VAAFRTVLKDQPDSVEVLTLLAAAHDASGQKELALETLSKAVEVKPGDADTRLRLAQYLANTGAMEAALEQIDTILAANPASVPALRAKAEILARQGHAAEVEEVLTRLEQASPETGIGAFGKGRLYKKRNTPRR
jgi:tetratricopeptide (TPR) repeat protein